MRTLMLTLTLSATAFGQTAREYYKEIHNAHGLNPLLMFVCFPQEEKGMFETMALTRTFNKTIEVKHLNKLDDPSAKKLFAKSDALYLETFYKGVAREPLIFDKEHKDSDTSWVYDFIGIEGYPKAKGRISFNINWQTLRYEKSVKIGVTQYADYGRCELIE